MKTRRIISLFILLLAINQGIPIRVRTLEYFYEHLTIQIMI